MFPRSASSFAVLNSLLGQRDKIRELDLAEEPKISVRVGPTFEWFPVPDRGVPTSTEAAHPLWNVISTKIPDGRSAGIHCRRHRTIRLGDRERIAAARSFRGRRLASRFPHLKRWFETIAARPATRKAYAGTTDVYAGAAGLGMRGPVSVRRNRGCPLNHASPSTCDLVLQDIAADPARFGCDAAGFAKDRFNLPVSSAIDGFRSNECFRPRRDDAAASSSTKSERANGEVRARKGGVCS
ncbi:MAG: hypothetical protein JWO04_3224 [Gammaproteobacteria bacterium]|nr:hypothetical protein [Gammaproteobacteria bacterium]